ncbi:hypothetical protein GW17_00037909 [Ensete ventricosum]|nr:hypothetical protein GW17_00037909 [Ensete ventricosum]
MRVHPVPKKRNITLRCGVNPAAAATAEHGRQKKLRRLPHIFSKVLELPLAADADVAVEEDADGFRFVAATDVLWGDVQAQTVQIHPGVTKVFVRDGSDGDDLDTELELNRWRFRLPSCTRPALATAAYTSGELVVTIPKGAGPEEDDGEVQEFVGGGSNEDFGGRDIEHLVLMLFVSVSVEQALLVQARGIPVKAAARFLLPGGAPDRARTRTPALPGESHPPPSPPCPVCSARCSALQGSTSCSALPVRRSRGPRGSRSARRRRPPGDLRGSRIPTHGRLGISRSDSGRAAAVPVPPSPLACVTRRSGGGRPSHLADIGNGDIHIEILELLVVIGSDLVELPVLIRVRGFSTDNTKRCLPISWEVSKREEKSIRKWNGKQIGTDIECSFQYFVAKAGVKGLRVPTGCTVEFLRPKGLHTANENPKKCSQRIPQRVRALRWGGGAWRPGASHFWLC